VAQFAPESLAQFAPDLVAQFDRNIQKVKLLKNLQEVPLKTILYLGQFGPDWVVNFTGLHVE
jgi:hypothetical protein